MKSTSRVFPEQITDWEDLASAMEFFRCLELGNENTNEGEEWVFRGIPDSLSPREPNSLNSLKTTLDVVASDFEVEGRGVERLEVDLILEFIRRYHLYAVEPPPEKGDTLDWLALMRHYGVPTRLLDFTFSFLVATFFAIERVEKNPKGNPTIWAVNKSWLSNTVPAMVENNKKLAEPFKRYLTSRSGNDFRDSFLTGRIAIVYPVNPFRLNERLTIQQGLFLCPGDVTKTFAENLSSIPGYENNVRQISIASDARKPLLMALHRANMNRATLFPGIDGFAQSLWTRAAWLKHLRGMEDAKARLKLNLDIESLREH